MFTEISFVLLLADSLTIWRIIRYGGTKLEIWSGKGACLESIGEVVGYSLAFKRSLLLSSFVMRHALEYDQPSPWIKAWLVRYASTLIVCDPSNLHIAFRLNPMDRHCDRVMMPLVPPHCMKNGFCLHVCTIFPIYFNVFITRDLFSKLIPRRRELQGDLTAFQIVK
jgi:hypothetical protein